jgi:hypothetical protein
MITQQQLIADLKINHLSEQYQKNFIEQFYATVMLRVGDKLVENLTENQLQALNKLTAENKHDEALDYLQSQNDNLDQLVNSEIEILAEEIKSGTAASITPAE